MLSIFLCAFCPSVCLQYFGHLMRRIDSLEKTLIWEGLGAGGEGDNRGWDGWMASPTRWTWVWVNSGSWWWTGRPGVLRFMGSQRVRRDWATELNWTELNVFGEMSIYIFYPFFDWVVWFLILSSLSCLHVLEINLIGCFICKYFLPFWRLCFCFVYGFLCCAKLFSLIRSHLFVFIFIILGGGSKKIGVIYVKEHSVYVFL